MIFKGLSVAKNGIRPKNAPLINGNGEDFFIKLESTPKITSRHFPSNIQLLIVKNKNTRKR